MKQESNYEIFKQEALKRFLRFEHNGLIERLGLQTDERYIYVDYFHCRYRISRNSPDMEKMRKNIWEKEFDTWFLAKWESATPNEVLTLCDLLCHTDKPILVSNEFKTLQRLNRVQGGSTQTSLGNGFWKKRADYFDGRSAVLCRACERLGGIPEGKGDVAYEIPLFDSIHMRFSYYESDDEFEPEMTVLFPANICDFLHYETLYYSVETFFEYLVEYIKLEESSKSALWGAIIGDISGSRFEFHNYKKKKEYRLLSEKCRFTDDSVMSIAVADAMMKVKTENADLSQNAIESMQRLGRRYPEAGYGGNFYRWIYSEHPRPYGSYGNGAAMRISACGQQAKNIEEAKVFSRKVTEISHDHPESFKAAEAVAVAIFMAQKGASLVEIREMIEQQYYKIDFVLKDIRRNYRFDVSCQGSVPQAFEAFFESTDFEDALRNAISIGGDSDTIAAICGSIAAAYYGIPHEVLNYARTYLDNYLLEIVDEFSADTCRA